MTRKEAIDKVFGMTGTAEQHEALDFLVPEVRELRESYERQVEDERVRKTLIHIVKGACDKYGIKYRGDEITEEKLLAYLERQKEQKSTDTEWAELQSEFKNINEAFEDGKKEVIDNPEKYGLQKEQKSIKIYTGPKDILAYVNMFIKKLGHVPIDIHELSACVHYVIKHKEEDTKAKQKSLGLSEMMVHKEPYIAPVPTPMVADEQKPIEWSYPYGRNETVDRLVSLAECLEMDGDCQFNGYSGTECGKFLRELARKQVECTSGEWSEEDKKHRAFILESLEDQIRFCKKDAEGAHYVKQIRTAQNWLKSLRPSLKPSEEQLEELNKVRTLNPGLDALYQQLKNM